MSNPTVSDQDLAGALRAAGHSAVEIIRVLNERRAWIKYRSELRDDFARAALQGMLADPNCGPVAKQSIASYDQQLARRCYEVADSMLRARRLPDSNAPDTLTEH